MQKLRDMLAQAQRPMVIVGGGGWSTQACDDLQAFVEAYNLPVGCVVSLPGPDRQPPIRITWATSPSA